MDICVNNLACTPPSLRSSVECKQLKGMRAREK